MACSHARSSAGTLPLTTTLLLVEASLSVLTLSSIVSSRAIVVERLNTTLLVVSLPLAIEEESLLGLAMGTEVLVVTSIVHDSLVKLLSKLRRTRLSAWQLWLRLRDHVSSSFSLMLMRLERPVVLGIRTRLATREQGWLDHVLGLHHLPHILILLTVAEPKRC